MITMSASATKWSPPPAHTPFTAAITGFHTSLCHAVSRSSNASIYNGDHHRTAGRCAGPGMAAAGGFVFDLSKGPTDKAGGTERYQRIFGSAHSGICLFVFCDGSVRPLSVSSTKKAVFFKR